MIQYTSKFNKQRLKIFLEEESYFLHYKNELSAQLKLLGPFDSAKLPVEGSFSRRLKARLGHWWALEYSRSIRPFLSLLFLEEEQYSWATWLLLWILFLPPLYFALYLFFYLIFRIPLFFYIFVKTFGESFGPSFSKQKIANSVFYRLLWEGNLLFHEIFRGYYRIFQWFYLDRSKSIFWRALYHLYIQEPWASVIHPYIWRFLAYYDDLRRELSLEDVGVVLSRRLRRPFLTIIKKPIRLGFLLLGPKGRAWMRLRYRLWLLRAKRFGRLSLIKLRFFLGRGRLEFKVFLIKSRSSLIIYLSRWLFWELLLAIVGAVLMMWLEPELFVLWEDCQSDLFLKIGLIALVTRAHIDAFFSFFASPFIFLVIVYYEFLFYNRHSFPFFSRVWKVRLSQLAFLWQRHRPRVSRRAQLVASLKSFDCPKSGFFANRRIHL